MTRFLRRHVQPHVERWVPSLIRENWRTLLFFAAIAWVSYFTFSFYNLAQDNRHLIREQQTSRIVSCRKTYEAFNEVFKPFFPPKKHRTTRQQNDLDKLHSTIDDLKARCAKQTATKGTP